MQIYEALKNDHDRLKGLLERLTQSADDSDESRKELIRQIRDELIPHSRAEEAVLYNSLRQIPEAKGVIAHSFAEHMEAEALLRAMQTMEALDVDWSSSARKLRAALEHHIGEEETKVFSVARQVLATEEAEMMATAFENIKPEVREGSFLKTTLELAANLMPVRFSSTLRNFLYAQ